MKTNTCNYSDEWQPYTGCYDKYEYDVMLTDGTVVPNCYPNAGEFHSLTDGALISSSGVAQIRFSAEPVSPMNRHVSERTPPEMTAPLPIAKRTYRISSVPGLGPVMAMAAMATISYSDLYCQASATSHGGRRGFLKTPPAAKGTRIEPRTGPKPLRNEPCPCGSGRKRKKCCS